MYCAESEDAVRNTAIEREAAREFVLALRKRWAGSLYPSLVAQYKQAGAAERNDFQEASVRELPAYPWFSCLERSSQKMLWRAVTAAVRCAAPLTLSDDSAAMVMLDKALRLPDWYTDWDIHVQPGGVWSSGEAAAVYEAGAKVVMLGENDEYAFHRDFVASAIPARSYGRIVDLGCGFGKSTWPLKEAFPRAEVCGVDLSAPCLQLAAQRVSERGLPIRFYQADACATPFVPSSVDLVCSSMLIHEMPVAALQALLHECARILAPGALLRFLDFRFTGDSVRDMAMREHGARNNEPFLAPAMAADLATMAEDAGLVNARWRAFDERGAGLLEELTWPQREEWHFPWAVLEAEMP